MNNFFKKFLKAIGAKIFSAPTLSRQMTTEILATPKMRAVIATAAIAEIFAGFAVHLCAISTGAAAERAQFEVLTRSPITLGLLNTKVKELQDTVQDIDNLSMHDLRQRLSEISIFLTEAQTEMENEQKGWEQLNLMVSANAGKYQALKSDIERLNAVKEDQLRLATAIVARESNGEANRDFYMGLIISFPLGVISSLLAAFAWERFKSSKRESLPPGGGSMGPGITSDETG